MKGERVHETVGSGIKRTFVGVLGGPKNGDCYAISASRRFTVSERRRKLTRPTMRLSTSPLVLSTSRSEKNERAMALWHGHGKRLNLIGAGHQDLVFLDSDQLLIHACG